MASETELSPELTGLERSVLEAAVGDGSNVAGGFQEQVRQASAVVRTPSGVGFVTKLQIPDQLRVTELPPDSSLPLVIGEHPELPSGAEFVLQVKDGRINSIEAFCYEGMWPSDETLFRLDAKR
jgi:hypothetical protein